jgi:hypothetical protein
MAAATTGARFHEITANYRSTGNCGHLIQKGDEIGWNPKYKLTLCEKCMTNIRLRTLVKNEREHMERMRLV